MTFNIEQIKVIIEPENNGLRLTTEHESFLLFNQTFEEIKETINKNYCIVKSHFQPKATSVITQNDLENVCLKIVLSYFNMYNRWRTMYPKEKNRDLTFLQKDFEHPNTAYAIISYFKKKYHDSYSKKCEILLEMTKEEFREYDIRKEQFDNLW
jgi:hypothetical protein